MSALTPISFKQGRETKPRLTPKYIPGRRDARFWSEAELDVIRAHYARDGAAACLAKLPKRNIRTIYQKANELGIGFAGPKGKRKTRTPVQSSDEITARISAAWPELVGRGSVQKLADELDVPRWWLSKEARRLGLTMPHKKEPPWTEAETALMSKVPLHAPDIAARIFREHGFARTPTAIVIRAKRLNLSRRYNEALSATAAAAILGMDSKTVAILCGTGALKASRRETRRLPQQGGDVWNITPADLRRYVIDHLERIDFRRVDKFALVDILCRPDTGCSDPAEQDSAGRTDHSGVAARAAVREARA